jgi:hypothetical protein
MPEWVQLVGSLGPSGLLALACYFQRQEIQELKAENKRLHEEHVREIKELYAQLLTVMTDWRKALERNDD